MESIVNSKVHDFKDNILRYKTKKIK